MIVIKNEFTRNDYVKLRVEEAREEGREEGRAEGRAEARARAREEGREEGIALILGKMHAGGMTIEEIAEVVQMTEGEVERILHSRECV